MSERTEQGAGGRIAWVDHARGAGIVLVVLGHAPLPALLEAVIYTFHMPLFFALSGLLAAPTLRLPPGRQVARLAHALLLPFAVFGAVTWLAHASILQVAMGQVPSSATLAEAAANIAWGVEPHIPANSTLWFFPALFLAAATSIALVATVGRTAALAATAIAAVSLMAFPLPHRLPWSADSALVGALFFQAGLALRDGIVAWRRPSARRLAASAVLALAATVLVAAVNGRVDLSRLVFGSPALYLAGAASGIAAMMCAAMALPASTVLVRLSRDSRVIFPMHMLVFRAVFWIAGAVTGLDRGVLRADGRMVPWLCVAGLAIPVLAGWVLRRTAPWTIGERTRAA